MRIFTAGLALFVSASAFAQPAPNVAAITTESLQKAVLSDTQTALAALDAGDFQKANMHLRAASDKAGRLSLRSLSQKIASSAPSFSGENARIALAHSSTIDFEGFLENGDALERRFTDGKGRVVTIRLFGAEQDLKDFMTIAEDAAMLDKASLERVEMAGETAIKRQGKDGALSVLMMSEDDHALIEIEGATDESVMAFIEELEDEQ